MARRAVKPMLQRIRDLLCPVLDRVAVAWARPAARRGVAVVLPHGIGDMVLYTPAHAALRAAFAGEPLLFVCTAEAEPYVRRQLRPDAVLCLDRIRMRRDMLHRMRVLRAMARAGVRVALQPGFNRDHLIEDALLRASGAAERIGNRGTDLFVTAAQRRRGDRWYTRLVDSGQGPHDTRRYAAFAREVTGRPLPDPLPRLDRPPRSPLAPPEPYLVVAHEASAPIKAWPAGHFLEAARIVAAQRGLAIVAVGRRRLGAPAAGLLDLGGRLDLDGLVAILAHARLTLTNDSAPAHLAAALGVPSIVVAGGGIPGRYLPYPAESPPGAAPKVAAVPVPWECFNCGWVCRYQPPAGTPAPCVAAVGIAEVTALAQAALDSAPGVAASRRHHAPGS